MHARIGFDRARIERVVSSPGRVDGMFWELAVVPLRVIVGAEVVGAGMRGQRPRAEIDRQAVVIPEEPTATRK